MDRIYLAQTPVYVPEPPPAYPHFDVSLQSPLPAADTFISTTFGFIAPPLTIMVGSFVAVLITKAIISSFKK